MWAFCEYISPKFSLICLIQHEKKYYTFLYISSKHLYLENLIWLEKMSMIFEFSVKKLPENQILYILPWKHRRPM